LQFKLQLVHGSALKRELQHHTPAASGGEINPEDKQPAVA
jgi:hypothetical protein